MSRVGQVAGLSCVLAGSVFGSEELLDRVRDALTVSSARGEASARISGTLDLEGHRVSHPATGLVFTRDRTLFNPRLTLFLDAQYGRHAYFFAQARVDRGFDPGDGPVRGRLDEYALRYTPAAGGRLSFQLGKFATVVGNWVPRHGSWENSFITAPLAYENVTGIWDSVAAPNAGVLLGWAHMSPVPPGVDEFADKHLRSPVIWGPAYASGAAVLGEQGRISYALEVKNAALSSRPEAWEPGEDSWRHPAINARLGYKPNMMWNLGISAGTGTYLRPSAVPTLPAGRGLGDYRQILLGQDLGFAWHYWQVWVESFQTRFEIPGVGDVEVFSHYAEVKYKFTPRFSMAARWNLQQFGDIARSSGQNVPWGRDLWRIDVAPAYRLTPHMQFKLQYSVQHETGAANNPGHTLAGRFTLRF